MCAGIAVIPAAASAFGTSDINEGELNFLDTPPQQTPHHQTKLITITPASLSTGWVRDNQCHSHLDRVPAMEIAFGAGRVRNLTIVSTRNIGRAWVEDNSVQMQDVGEDASICIESDNRLLERDHAHREYLLLSGPYMRRFLDGYFPMQVKIVVRYPDALLRFESAMPDSLRPYLRTEPGLIEVNTLFEGRLAIGLRFFGV